LPIIIILGILLWFGIKVISNQFPTVTTKTTQESLTSDSDTSATEEADEDKQVVSLKPVDGLEAKGTASRTYSKGNFTLSVSAALPALEDGGYYEVFLVGLSQPLGRLNKESGTYKLTYSVFNDLRIYNQIKVVVDGPRNLNNQPRSLPFDILIGEFE
jgi:hypothetical protein